MGTRNATSSSADGVLGSPLRNLAAALIFVVMVFAAATMGYFAAGWTPGDAAYMVTLTIFSVGYDEVHPINATYLRPGEDVRIEAGDAVVLVVRGSRVSAGAIFTTPRRQIRVGRTSERPWPAGGL